MYLIRKLPTLLAGLVFALLFGEVFVRVMAPQPLLPRNVTGSTWGIRQNVPGARYRQLTEDVDVGFRINSQGLRADRDYPMTPPAGTCRIAITGDSFIAGYESEAADTIAGRLDAAMAKRGYRTETLNFGVSGFGNAEELVQFEKRILPFRPTVLVQGFHVTDFEDNRRSGLFALTPDGRLERRGRSYLPGVEISDRLMAIAPYAWLDAHSQLFAAVRQAATDSAKKLIATIRSGNFRKTRTNADKGDANSAAAPLVKDALTSALLRRTYDDAKSNGVGWVLLEIPERQPGGKLGAPLDNVFIDTEMQSHVVSPIDIFRASPGVDMYRPHGHGHFTEEGNRVSTELIADAIVRTEGARLGRCAAADAQ
jgi:hypothetical protein